MAVHEFISLIISCLVMGFVFLQWHQFKRIQNFSLLFLCFVFVFAASAFSVFEHFYLYPSLNFLQHFASALSGILLAIWCRLVYVDTKKDTPGQ